MVTCGPSAAPVALVLAFDGAVALFGVVAVRETERERERQRERDRERESVVNIRGRNARTADGGWHQATIFSAL